MECEGDTNRVSGTRQYPGVYGSYDAFSRWGCTTRRPGAFAHDCWTLRDEPSRMSSQPTRGRPGFESKGNGANLQTTLTGRVLEPAEYAVRCVAARLSTALSGGSIRLPSPPHVKPSERTPRPPVEGSTAHLQATAPISDLNLAAEKANHLSACVKGERESKSRLTGSSGILEGMRSLRGPFVKR